MFPDDLLKYVVLFKASKHMIGLNPVIVTDICELTRDVDLCAYMGVNCDSHPSKIIRQPYNSR